MGFYKIICFLYKIYNFEKLSLEEDMWTYPISAISQGISILPTLFDADDPYDDCRFQRLIARPVYTEPLKLKVAAHDSLEPR